ncbi:MAG TPA: tetratricopeptide repeat protein [Sphingomicrobium sp.]|jgi:Flp pilus assembly protein TadD|nr:tetratricopeptide repeat protein [Sphingomicrobium sp.]
MIWIFVAAAIASQTAPTPDLGEVEHAIQANRLEQARQMIADATREGRSGPELDRLMADLAFAQDHWAEAQARYAELLKVNASDARSAERAGIAALKLGNRNEAREFLQKAISSHEASWQAWNALGALYDGERDWDGADAAYATAEELAPGQPQVLNNHGWSLLLRGEWASAIQVLEKAALADPKSQRALNNLELARAAVASELPRRRLGESDSEFAARLNDAGVAAEMRGQRDKAVAAFARALTVSDSWYSRAANNLATVQPK